MKNTKEKNIDGWWLYVRSRIKEDKEIIGIEKFNNTKILIDINDELQDDITLISVVVLMTCVMKDDNKFYV